MFFMWQEGLKLAMAGLMIILDLMGINQANQQVINATTRLGIEQPYAINNNEENDLTIATVRSVATPQLRLATRYPKVVDSISQPVVDAQAIAIIDAKTATLLYAKNADEKRAIASVTKLMTALVALDNLKTNDAIVVQPQDVEIEPTTMNLTIGESITVGDLMRGLLIVSANDAALTLGRVAGDGDLDNFVKMMNEKASKMGLKNSHFSNPHGLDQDGLYSSAKDMALIAKNAIDNPIIAEIVSTKETTVTSIDGSISHSLKNTNKLLDSYLNVYGVKTGFTDNAGQVLITAATNKDGDKIICVVLGSNDRFQDSKVLIDWTFGNFYWE
ncbi:MAG: D-alanyl-D-alanine carboxypeptidase family protein [Patescibacteria group bacterium]